jgi:hypothetical protein
VEGVVEYEKEDNENEEDGDACPVIHGEYSATEAPRSP